MKSDKNQSNLRELQGISGNFGDRQNDSKPSKTYETNKKSIKNKISAKYNTFCRNVKLWDLSSAKLPSKSTCWMMSTHLSFTYPCCKKATPPNPAANHSTFVCSPLVFDFDCPGHFPEPAWHVNSSVFVAVADDMQATCTVVEVDVPRLLTMGRWVCLKFSVKLR